MTTKKTDTLRQIQRLFHQALSAPETVQTLHQMLYIQFMKMKMNREHTELNLKEQAQLQIAIGTQVKDLPEYQSTQIILQK